MSYHNWIDLREIPPQAYRCGHCGHDISSAKGYITSTATYPVTAKGRIYICHHCDKPTYIDFYREKQSPGAAFGDPIKDISDKPVLHIYNEARQCMSCNAHTAAVLSCRKLLMHIAVAKGAEPGESFVHYVNFLAEKNYIPPGARDWVDHIRTRGNEANHEISIMTEDDAKELISFASMLLKIIYEFPASIKRHTHSEPKAPL